ncbi:unnamed protein product [Nesidiocoris tenuis]|uniref:Uncharacterized protein n=1 Tax=Nesidiocoris tenuis TaxID=355587 RepID=A0A6H5GA05_9HEMI|nr:unnamed protein product [Nesidiocoris tenuis]CAA9999186.1 unnamed protein product [Nesidiocoris tenuis]
MAGGTPRRELLAALGRLAVRPRAADATALVPQCRPPPRSDRWPSPPSPGHAEVNKPVPRRVWDGRRHRRTWNRRGGGNEGKPAVLG